jgi:hypothetical protein
VVLKQLSLADLYLGWTIVFTMVLGMVGFINAPNKLLDLIRETGTYASAGPFAAVPFAVCMWAAIKLAGA